jgi:hypothetical protein
MAAYAGNDPVVISRPAALAAHPAGQAAVISADLHDRDAVPGVRHHGHDLALRPGGHGGRAGQAPHAGYGTGQLPGRRHRPGKAALAGKSCQACNEAGLATMHNHAPAGFASFSGDPEIIPRDSVTRGGSGPAGAS